MSVAFSFSLGAATERVQLGVIARTMRLVLAGITLGTIGSFAVAKWIAALLFRTEPTDPATFAVAFIAGYIPARRASRIDPMPAPRGE